jgi:hypothetical protein
METVQAVRFYNGGDRKFERLQYTAAEYDIKVENGVRYFVLDAPRKGFFDVPREIRTETGAAQLLGLPGELKEKYGDRGFVMVDRNMSDEQCDGQPLLANSDDMAREKGDKLWRDYCFKLVKEFEENNERRVTIPLPKLQPSPFILHAYKELGLTPPGDEEKKKAIEGSNTIEMLQQQVALLTALVTKQNGSPTAAESLEAEAEAAEPQPQTLGRRGRPRHIESA